MAPNDIDLFGLEFIGRRNLSGQDNDILSALSHGMQPATREVAAEAARRLDRLCPPLEQGKTANDYLWAVWEIMIDAARSPDSTSEIQERLISILEELRQCAKGYLSAWGYPKRVWMDVPLLPMCLDASFSDPTDLDEGVTPESTRVWHHLNAFGARCTGAGIVGLFYQAMEALRLALEEPNAAEWRIKVASEWICHGSKPLFRWAANNAGLVSVTVEDTANYAEAGQLYQGMPTMCPQRWSFWLARFEEIGKEESGMSEEVRKAALEAAGTMRTVETGGTATQDP